MAIYRLIAKGSFEPSEIEAMTAASIPTLHGRAERARIAPKRDSQNA